ncbi:hypothetical protein BVY03_05340 [bacterium K02(2017)]|nr:hypothetical protein BVY03_05340 [bacterium K02(2017)]
MRQKVINGQIPLVFIGASAFSEIVELVRDINRESERYEIVGILDDSPDYKNKKIEGVPVLGSLDKIPSLNKDIKFVFGIGSFKTRLLRYSILQKINLSPQRFETLIHPTAKIYQTANVGQGCLIHCGSVIANHSQIGSFSIVLYNTVIGANNIIGPGALITSHVTTNSGVKIGSYSFIGSHSAIAENIQIGPGSMVAMGSVVLRDIQPGCFKMGTPPITIEKSVVDQNILSEWAGILESKKIRV